MIRYALLCHGDHRFESWFRDSAAYDSLAAAGQVACPDCGSTTTRKALMSPSVVTSRRKAAEAREEPAAPLPTPEPTPMAPVDDRARQLRAMARALHRRITETADNVGRAFAAEARAIHEQGAPARSIYGEATAEEVGALIEDGIPLMPMPVPPDDHH